MPLLFSIPHAPDIGSVENPQINSNEILVDNLIPINSVRDRELSFDWWFNPLALRALHLSLLRWAEGEDWNVTSSVLNFSIAVPRSITGCGVSHIREVAHSDGEVEKDNMFFAWRFNPLALRALPLSHLRWAEGEDWNVTSSVLNFSIAGIF